MKIYITKYALTKGIQEVDVEPKTTSQGCLTVRLPGSAFATYLTSKDYSDSLEGAMEKAEALRQNKIQSLEKSLKKLKTMKIRHVVVESKGSSNEG